MSRIVYLNGEFVALAEARIPIMDRGFLFGDGIYEVTAVLAGRLIDNGLHLERLRRSLEAIDITNPYDDDAWTGLQNELARRNNLAEGLVYIEVTRGVFERDFLSPSDLAPTVVMFTQARSIVANPLARSGARVITIPDLRWKRRDIKSVSLLAQVLGKRAAWVAGAAEAWLVEDGAVTEGASSTAFIATQDRTIITRPLSTAVLAGVTREAVLRLVARNDLRFEQRAFTVGEAYAAAEAFYTGASTLVMPVVEIDGRPVGDGRPGPLALELRRLYVELAGAA